MAAPATQNPQVKSESKSAKKKKAKAASADSESASTLVEVPSNEVTESNGGDGSYESPYIKDLYKNIRNINKKISNASKVDGIVAEHPDKSLDQLVAERKINADQKAQILKKPGLQQQLQQFEEQIAQFKKFDSEYKAATHAEKTEFEKSHTDRSSKELEQAVAAAKGDATTSAREEQESNLLLLSQFLRLAAIRRGEDEDSELEENKALEGVLGRVYTGDSIAVATMLSLIDGTDEKIYSVNGDLLTVSYADIKRVALAQSPPSVEGATEPVDEPVGVETTEYPVQSDPTIANAGMTELDDTAAIIPTNGDSTLHEVEGIPQNSGFGGEGGANAAATQNWDNQNDLSTSQEWVEVPRDSTETDTGFTATPAAPSNVQSWADDQPDSPTETSVKPETPKDDGFHQVQRNRGGNRGGQGQFRGNRGGRGDNRGGRGRGDGYRGRGRGGGGGGPRGGRRPDES